MQRISTNSANHRTVPNDPVIHLTPLTPYDALKSPPVRLDYALAKHLPSGY
ncbi:MULTISPECIES: hypothetical protein [unclassified Acinetobacter]|uniref:hypothetical protein n=1 Tax=unclassified Acinetobacter TaxID=196816 RepID=UPI0015D22349|nr:MULTISPECIES: hypothetical protein [unclassified Acinetobacter]